MLLNRWDEAIREMERAKDLDPLSLVIVVSLAATYDGAERWREAEAMYDQVRALAPDHPLTLLFGFGHDLMHGHTEQAASDYRRLMVATGADSIGAADMERRLRDPALRKAAVRRIEETAHPLLGVVLLRAFDGDDATIAYLAGLVSSPRREVMNKEILYGFLGPRLRADPRMQAVLIRLGYPRS